MGDLLVYNMKSILEKVPKEERNRDYVVESLENILKLDNEILGLGVYFKENAFDGKDEAFKTEENPDGKCEIYSYKKDGKIMTTKAFNAEGKSWWDVALEEKRNVLLPPYITEDSHDLVITYTYPIIVSNEVQGVAIIDMDLTKIQAFLVEKVGNDKKDFMMLIANTGFIVANSADEKEIGENTFEKNQYAKEYVDLAQSGKDSIIENTNNITQSDSKLIFTPVNTKTNEKWVFESVTDMDIFTKETKKEILFGAIIYLFSIAIIFSLIVFITRNRVTRPLLLLQGIVDKISKYNLDISDELEFGEKNNYNLKNDEIGFIYRSLKEMAEHLKELISSISDSAQSTAATSEELVATSQSVADASKEVDSAVSSIANAATDQSQDTTKAAENVDENTASLRQMIQASSDLKQAVDNIDSKKNEGKVALDELKGLTIKSSEETIVVSKIIQETNESAEHISKASEMIQSIADQTNLLALNAAIDIAVVM